MVGDPYFVELVAAAGTVEAATVSVSVTPEGGDGHAQMGKWSIGRHRS